MVYYVNNAPQEVAASCTIAAALARLDLTSPRGLAVAVNDTVVPHAEWDAHPLLPNDRLTLIRATQGG